jgi:hypothetical protein
MPEYTHTLIPDRVNFAPDPKQVGSFLTSLMTLGAAPLMPPTAPQLPRRKPKDELPPRNAGLLNLIGETLS